TRPTTTRERLPGLVGLVALDPPYGGLIRKFGLMSIEIPERDLPAQLTAEQAVEMAYASELSEVASKLQRGLPTLVECDKDLAPYLYKNLRNRLKPAGLRCLYLDGRVPPEQQNPMDAGLIGTMIQQLRDAVRGAAVERRVV